MLQNGFRNIKDTYFDLFAAHWVLWGRSWAPLGALLVRSWALLGPSWALLGRSWNDMQKSSPNQFQKCPIWTPQNLPTKSNPKSTRNRYKKRCKRITDIEPT